MTDFLFDGGGRKSRFAIPHLGGDKTAAKMGHQILFELEG